MRVVARTLSGFKDKLPKEAIAKSELLGIVSGVFKSFGFVPIETPHLEYADILTKQGSDEIQKELYRFKDHGGRDVALRFDQTVPLARFISQHRSEIDLPFKRYAIGNVFRGERAQKGRYREFTQCDFDFIGSTSIACDAEIVQVIYASLVALGINEFTIWLNNRKILNGICKYFGIKEPAKIAEALRIIDKMDKIGQDCVKDELNKNLNINATDLIKATNIKQNGDGSAFFKEIADLKKWNSDLECGINELERVYEMLDFLQMDKDSYRINFSIARGLGYYTGIVYETTLHRHKDLGSVCSGGRYDNLARSFSEENISGVGASIGIDRLLVALENDESAQTTARVLIICLEEKYFNYAFKIAESFRRSKIPSEVYAEVTKPKKSFHYANLKGHEFVAVIGEDEIKNKGITLKNMTSGMQMKNLSLLKAIELLRG